MSKTGRLFPELEPSLSEFTIPAIRLFVTHKIKEILSTNENCNAGFQVSCLFQSGDGTGAKGRIVSAFVACEIPAHLVATSFTKCFAPMKLVH